MLNKVVAFTILILILSFLCGGQTPPVEKWTRIEAYKSEVSVTFPPDYLIDARSHADGQFFRAIAYQNGVMMEMKIEKYDDGRNRLNRTLPNGDEKGYAFTMNGVQGRQMSSQSASGYSERIYLASGDRYYSLRVVSPNTKKIELRRFSYSIEINGQPFYERKSIVNFPEDAVSAESLKTSNTVKEAFERKSDKQKINVEFNNEAKFVEPPTLPINVRPALIVDRQNPDMRSLLPFGFGRPPPKMSARLVIKLLANGQVGDIEVYSGSNKNFARACVEAAKKIKFVPARQGDRDIDSITVQDYDVLMAAVSGTILVPGSVR